MINIDTKEFEKEVVALGKLISDYEKNYLNLFKELSDASFYWKEDVHAKAFFNGLKFEEAEEVGHYNSIVKTYKVFEYIKNKYSQIGKKIQVNIDDRDSILAKFNNCINKTSEIIVLYEHLDTSFCEEEKGLVASQINKLYKLKKEYINIKHRVKDILDTIIEIEKEVKNRLANYHVDQVRDFDLNLFLPEE